MRPIAHLADHDDAIAFAAFRTLVLPAVRDAARGPLRRARHAGRACHGPVGTEWCAECEVTVDDLLLESFTRLRAALTGPVPQTRSGEPVRELAALRAHLQDPQAWDQDTRAFAATLRAPAGDDEPRWLRAARAQLVHYPLRHLEAQTRRADAVRRGAAARPDRDLREAVWAAPLRADPVVLDLLFLAVFRVRRGTADLFEVPADLCERHGLDRAEATRRMGEALTKLRAANSGFFAANLGEHITGVPGGDRAAAPWVEAGDVAGGDPQERLNAADDRRSAREILLRLVAERPGEPAARTRRCRAYRAVAAQVCAVGSGDGGDPVGAAIRLLGLAPETAARLVRRLVVLIAAAGVEWSARLASPTVSPASAQVRPPAPAQTPTNGSPPRAPRRPVQRVQRRPYGR
jgi:hypothetical protein